MGQTIKFWNRRPKRRSRKIAHDLRVLTPGIAVLFCLGSAATVIAAAESIPNQYIPATKIQFENEARLASRAHAESSRLAYHVSDGVSDHASDHAAVNRAGLDPRRADCGRPVLVNDFDELDFKDES